MNNPESGETKQVNVEKEHAQLDQEFANLKKEQEDLLKELKNGSSEDLLDRFKILQKKLEELRIRVEVWNNEHEDVVFSRLKEKLMESRKLHVRKMAEMILDKYGQGEAVKLVYEKYVEKDEVRVVELLGEDDKFMRGIREREYQLQQLGPVRFFNAFVFDQGVETPPFSVENLSLFAPHKVSVGEVAGYSRFFSKAKNSSDFFKISSFADYFYSQYKDEYYLPGMDALLFMLADMKEPNMDFARYTFAKKILDLLDQKYGTEINSFSDVNFIFPGLAVVDFIGNLVFPALSYNVKNKGFTFMTSDISKTVANNDIFVLFSK